MNDLKIVLERMNGAVRSPQVLELLSVYYALDNLPWEMSQQLSIRQKLSNDKCDDYWNAQECEHEHWTEGLGNVNDQFKYRLLELIGLAYIFNSASESIKSKLTEPFDYFAKAEPDVETFALLLTAAVREYHFSKKRRMEE